MFTMINFKKARGTEVPVWIPAACHAASEWRSRPNRPHPEAGYSCLFVTQRMGSRVLHIPLPPHTLPPVLWPNSMSPLSGSCPHHCFWRWFLVSSFQAELSGCLKFKYLLWVWLQPDGGLKEVHSASRDPWCAWKSLPSTTLLASPPQVNEGPELHFFLIFPKTSGFSHHGRQGTAVQAYEKFRYQILRLYILMTKLDLL